MTDPKWEPVAKLMGHMLKDDDLLMRWGLAEYGDVRSPAGRAALVEMKRADMQHLLIAVKSRVGTEENL